MKKIGTLAVLAMSILGASSAMAQGEDFMRHQWRVDCNCVRDGRTYWVSGRSSDRDGAMTQARAACDNWGGELGDSCYWFEQD